MKKDLKVLALMVTYCVFAACVAFGFANIIRRAIDLPLYKFGEHAPELILGGFVGLFLISLCASDF